MRSMGWIASINKIDGEKWVVSLEFTLKNSCFSIIETCVIINHPHTQLCPTTNKHKYIYKDYFQTLDKPFFFHYIVVSIRRNAAGFWEKVSVVTLGNSHLEESTRRNRSHTEDTLFDSSPLRSRKMDPGIVRINC